MNGEINPNANRMGNFGRANHMNSGGGNAVNVNDLLPKDPTKEQKPRWIKQSEQQHEQKQTQIARKHDQIIPESFKRSPAFQTKSNHPTSNQNKYQGMRSNPQHHKSQPQQPQQPQQPIHRNKAPPQQKQVKQPQLQQQQRTVDQPVAEPYYSKKGPDPFAKFVNNSNYQRDLKDHGIRNKQSYASPNVENIGQHRRPQPQPQPQLQQHQQQQQPSNKMRDVVNAICSRCNKKITDAWTEDARHRMFHDECFVCAECGVVLGPLGKYVTVEKGVICKSCRNKQVLAKTK